MEFLFDSRGSHIANLVGDQLHAPSGSNIGHWLANPGIFIDMDGRYLGEIVADNRLLRRRTSPYAGVNYGVYGNYGNVGNYGNPGRRGVISLPFGFEDVDTIWLG